MTVARNNTPVVGVVTGIAVVLLILLIAFSFNLSKLQKNYRNETSEKMKIEEKVNSLSQLVATLTEEKAKMEKEFTAQKYTVEIMTKELLDVKQLNESLKEELSKLSKYKDKIEDDLKEALYKKSKDR
mgnify:CR=1 FL=1